MNKEQKKLVKTARIAGGWYLIMAISGVLGFMVVHPQVFDTEDIHSTLNHLIELEWLARTRILLEFAIIVSQALTAVWFYRLFKNIQEWAAWTVGIWGTINAMVIMMSAIAMAAAVDFANTSYSLDEKVIIIELLTTISSHAWGVGSLFFGLWLIPMGTTILSSKRMPLGLGYTLVIGGVGYLLSLLINYIGFDNEWFQLFTLPATIGEFWMIGYLLIFGIRPKDQYEEQSTS